MTPRLAASTSRLAALACVLAALPAAAPPRAQEASVRDEAAFIEALARDGFGDVARRRLDALRARLGDAPSFEDAAPAALAASRLARAEADRAAPPDRAERLRRGAAELEAAVERFAATAPPLDLVPLRLEGVELARALAAALPRDDALRQLEGARLGLETVHSQRRRAIDAELAKLPLRPGPDAARDTARERLQRAQVDAWLPILDQARLCFVEADLLAQEPADPERRRVRLRSARELSDQFVSKIGPLSLRSLDARLLAGRAALALGDAEGGARRLRRLLEGDEDVAAALDAWPGLDAGSIDELLRVAERAVLELAREADEAGRAADAIALEARLEVLAARRAGRPEGPDAAAARWQIAHARARGGAPGGVAALDAAWRGATDEAARARLADLLLDLVDDPALRDATSGLPAETRRALDGRRSPFRRAVASWEAARALPAEARDERAARLAAVVRLGDAVAPDSPDRRRARLLALRGAVALAEIAEAGQIAPAAETPPGWSEALARADALLAELEGPAGDARLAAEALLARAAILDALGRSGEAVALAVRLTAGEPPAEVAGAAAWCEAFWRSIAALPADQREAARGRLREFDRRFVAAHRGAADFEARLGGAPWRARWDELRAALR